MAEAGISGLEDLLRAEHGDAEAPLQRMVDAIKAGSHASFIPFGRHGRPMVFE
jgi:hypothetical protein